MYYRTFKLSKCVISALTILLCVACGQKKEITPSTEFAQYIKAYTGGTITSASSIRIVLNDEALGALSTNGESMYNSPENDEQLTGLFSFSPSLKGRAHWISSSEIEFIPQENSLKSGQIYNASFKLGRITDVEDNSLENFKFSFRVLPKVLSIEIEGVEISAEDQLHANVSGILHSNTGMSAEQARKFIRFKYPKVRVSEPNTGNNGSNSAEPELLIDGNENGHQFKFTIAGLGRNEKDNSLFLTCDGSRDGFGELDEVEVTVPAIGKFQVLSSELRSNGNGHFIELRFSDPLAESALDAGLITVNGAGSCNLELKGNVVRAHLSNINEYGNVELRVSPAIQNTNGFRLGRTFNHSYSIGDIVPAVELLFNGHILPDNSLLVLPFRTRGLCAIDVSVIKIFENNVLAFFQNNGLEGSDELRRYGRLIYRNTVQICPQDAINAREWTESTLDLSSMFKQEPGAIYRIRLSFCKDYTIYANAAPEGSKVAGKSNGGDESDDFASSEDMRQTLAEGNGTIARVGNAGMVKMGKPEGEDVWDEPYPYIYENDYDWREYRWKDRDNPATPTFYMQSSRYPVCNLISSNIGIVAKKAHGNKLWVSVADILKASPVSGADVVVYNYQLQEIGRAKTDSDGFAQVDCNGKPFLVKAGENGNRQYGYLKITDAEEISLSRFDTGGAVRSLGLKGFVYGERGVWRPGDTLHLSLMIEGENEALPENHPVIAELYNARGQYHSKMVCNKGLRGLYSFNIPTMPSDPTGIWNIYFKYGGATFHKALNIETVKPNRLKVNMSIKPEILVAGESANVEIASSWLTGPAAANLKFSSSMTVSKLNKAFKGYEDYVFSNPLSNFKTFTGNLVSGNLNSEGRFETALKVPQAQGAGGMLNASIVTQVFENGGDASINTTNVLYAPFRTFTGIRLAASSGTYGSPEFETDTDIRFPVIVLSPEGKPVSGHNLEYAIYKIKWSWWWENHDESLDSYINGSDARKIISGKLISSSQTQNIAFKIEYPEYGRFLVYVLDKDSGHSTGGIFFVDWPSWRGRSNKSDPSALQMLTFTTDKKSYEVGEEAVVFIPSAAHGRALVSIENGSSVISRQWVPTKEEGTKFKIKVTKEMTPNFYVHITLLQPHKGRNNDLPIRMYGVQPVLVQDKDSRLEPELNVPEVLRPQQEFSISVKEKNDKPMAYTIAIVDDGLLDLTNFKTPDPWNKMNEREALGVHTWDLYDNVIGAYSGKFSPIAGIGGDEDKIVAGRKENRFNPVVRFIGPFNLEKGRTATHKITLPMYVGSVRFMLVACDTKKYGSCEKTVPVRSPLMVLSSLPASIACGETLSLPVNVFAMEKDVRNVQVTVKAEGALSILGTSSQSLSFTGDGDKISFFRLAASSEEGSARITVTASCGQHKAQEVINVEVLNNQPNLTSFDGIMLESGASHVFDSGTLAFEPGSYSASLQLSTFPAVDFQTMFINMYHYKYNCSEQILSKGLTALYLKDLLAEGAGDPKNGGKGALNGNARYAGLAEEMVNEALRELYGRQNSSGGFVYWPGDGTTNEWVTAMAGHFMAKAMSCGYDVNKNVFNSWKKYETQQANAYMRAERKLDDLMQAYRLYSLALAGASADGAMNRLKASENLSVQAAWRLAAAYSLAGKKSIATELIERLNTSSESNSEAWYWFGSQARDNAMMLESALLADDMMRAMSIARKLENDFRTWSYNTQFCAFSSVALNLLAQKVQKSPVDVSIAKVDSKITEQNESSANNTAATTITSGNTSSAEKPAGNASQIKTTANFTKLDISKYGSSPIEVKNNGKTAVYVVLARNGKPAVSNNKLADAAGQKAGGSIASYRVPETSSNLKLEVSYLDGNGRIINPAKLKQGDEFSIEINVVSVNNIGAVNNLALDMAVPSGWEIFNERLFTAGSNTENCTYKDIRDKRIVWYFNLPENGSHSFRAKLRAAFAGEFILPAIQCSAMYDPMIHANTASGNVIVEP